MNSFTDGYIGYSGQLDGGSGYGRSGHAALRNLIRLGYHVTHYGPRDLGEFGPSLGYLEPRLKDLDPEVVEVIEREDRAEPEWTLLHSIPNPLPFIPSPKKIIWTMWETHRIPQNTPIKGYSKWDWVINEFANGLIVPTTKQRDLFLDSGVEVPTEIVHMGIDTDAFPYVTRSGPNGRPFTFFSWSFMDARKCPMETVNAFLSAFGPNNPDVRLVMKTMHGQFGMGRFGIPHIPFDNVQIIDEQWPQPQLQSFLETEVDACVFLSHGEGFFMPPLEALSTGLPVVVSDNTGSSDFCNWRYLYPVRQRGWESCPWGEGAQWCQPDYDDAINQLRLVYDDYETAVRRAMKGAAWAHERWSIRHQRGDLQTALDRLLR